MRNGRFSRRVAFSPQRRRRGALFLRVCWREADRLRLAISIVIVRFRPPEYCYVELVGAEAAGGAEGGGRAWGAFLRVGIFIRAGIRQTRPADQVLRVLPRRLKCLTTSDRGLEGNRCRRARRVERRAPYRHQHGETGLRRRNRQRTGPRRYAHGRS